MSAVAESEWTQKLLASCGSLRVGVVAPAVSCSITGASPVNSALAQLPTSEITRLMEEEILPQFVRCFTEDSQDRHGGGGGGGSEGPAQLAELLEIGRDKAPTECAWLMAHVREIKAVVEEQLPHAAFATAARQRE